MSHQHGDFIMSNDTEKPKIQPDESQEQKKEQDEILPQSGEKSAKVDGEVANDNLRKKANIKPLNPRKKLKALNPIRVCHQPQCTL